MIPNFEEIFGKFDAFEYRERKPMDTLIYGVGINDSPFQISPTIAKKQIRHPAYLVWRDMLFRCYNSDYKEKHPTYIGVTCCDEWLLFTNFAKWFKDNYVKGWQLDKDVLVKDNKIYYSKSCIFVPQEINKFLTLRINHRGELPIGVTLHQGKFQSRIRDVNLGHFNSKEQAHLEWQKAKLEQAIAFNFPPLQRVIDQLTYEIENNLETTSL